MHEWVTDPAEQEFYQGVTLAWLSLKDQTPKINVTGDEATYQMTMPYLRFVPPGAQVPMMQRILVLQKIDGKWYFKVGDIL